MALRQTCTEMEMGAARAGGGGEGRLRRDVALGESTQSKREKNEAALSRYAAYTADRIGVSNLAG